MLKNINETMSKIISWLQEYKERTGCRGVVIGLSGGKDSTTVAMLCKKVWGNNVYAVLMPNKTQTDIDDSIYIAKTLDLRYQIVNIKEMYKALLDEVERVDYMDSNGLPYYGSNGVKVSSKAKTNIPPRLRMTVLYAIAQSLGYRVAGTGNASEGYVGWCTKYGDCAYDFNPIAHLTCTQVVELGKELAKEFGIKEKYITKPPADGLTGKTDEENLGFSYKELDEYLMFGIGNEQIIKRIEEMHKASEHKRTMPPSLA